MNRFWGDASWQKAAYQVSPQQMLFGEPDLIKVDAANEKIAEAYRQRLLSLATFKYAPSPLAFKNSLGRTVYYLFFASPNQTGSRIVEDIFGKHRKS